MSRDTLALGLKLVLKDYEQKQQYFLHNAEEQINEVIAHLDRCITVVLTVNTPPRKKEENNEHNQD